MNNSRDISRLARLLIKEDGGINERVADFALKNLSRRELATLLRSVKRIVSQKFVSVYHNDIIPSELKREIEKKYEDKKVLFLRNDEMVDGVKIIYNDTIVDLTIKGHINNALESLKS